MSNSRYQPDIAARAAAVLLLATGLCAAQRAAAAEPPATKKIVLLAGTVHQGAGGHPPGTHEYELTARLLQRALATAPNVSGVKCEVHVQGWPRDDKTLDDADSIVVISDGADRDPQMHPLLVGDRRQVLKKQMDRGCGLVAIHWTLFVPTEPAGNDFLEWIGGYFDYERGTAANKWYSKIQTAATTPKPATPSHPISRGLAPFPLREEYYYGIRFRENDPRRVPILTTPIPGEAAEQTVAWAVERKEGGRGFGFTGGHFFENWGIESFRRMVLNAILWTAHVEVPPGGVQSTPAEQEPQAAAADPAIQAVIVTGHQHPAHLWRETTAALQEALAPDRRFQLTVVTDPEFLATKNLASYDVVILNYCNWQRAGLSDAAKANFVKYIDQGGGLVILHFANGAFHASLPETPPSDWPEYRNLCRRVWDHAAGRSSHDPYGRFRVDIVQEHPITSGLNSFETIDELYCNQQGELPIEVLATAHSRVTGRDEPMAFVYSVGRGRVFQTVLGHAAESIRVPAAATLIRRGAVWAANRPQRAVAPRAAQTHNSPPKLIPAGRFGAALDPRQSAASAARRDAYEKRPLSVECWARLDGKTGFNILVAHSAKESAEHWELYTYAADGDLSLYLPGFTPAEIRSGVNVVDGAWHYLAATFDETEARLYVDGKQCKRAAIARTRSGGPAGPLYFGGYPPQGIGCDGLVDEVRVSSTLRDINDLPLAPLAPDAATLGLWHFDRLEGAAVEDASASKNPASSTASATTSAPLATRRVADPALALMTLDSSPDESFLSLRADTMGRLFVGGREALFVYEPAAAGGYEPRKLLYRFPPDTWITDVEIRGDDLYVMTNAALYLIPGGRLARENLTPRRLLWGTPVDLHVTWHGLAWGPEGDLYFSSGDPLLNFGDFQNRPDHWGHWTIYSQPEGTKVPYTGVGGFFRCRPDGSRLQVVAGGTRGAVGIVFDRRWNLFSNDNDHESIADRYSPARLLHVAPGSHFFWPRGWIASMSPERSDLLEIASTSMGRDAPVGQTYYDDPWLGPAYADSVLVARWGQRKVDGFSLAERGASFSAREYPLLVGEETARPVGVAVGRGGRVFVTLSYMAGNEWSPKYPSELAVITRRDDPRSLPFDGYDAPAASPARLWSELSSASVQRRQQAHCEILRRGGALLAEAASRLAKVGAADPARFHLPWLAAASLRPQATAAVVALTRHPDPEMRRQAIRAIDAFELDVPPAIFATALADPAAAVQHAAIVALTTRSGPLPEPLFAGPARSDDTYLRQASAFLIGRRATQFDWDQLSRSSDPRQRLSGVLAAGFRLTVPESIGELPPELPLRYESGNAQFVIRYAEATVDLKQLARVGSFTTAERWRSVPRSEEERGLSRALIAALDDDDDRVRAQAGYFLWLLNDDQINPLVLRSQRAMQLRQLSAGQRTPIRQVWRIGPFDDGEKGSSAVHPPQLGPIDLSATIEAGGARLTWEPLTGDDALLLTESATKSASSYLYFRLQSLQAQRVAISAPGDRKLTFWHDGREVDGPSPWILQLGPGSNDILLRAEQNARSDKVSLELQAFNNVAVTMPEKLPPSALAQRLKHGGDAAGTELAAEFLATDWASAPQRGNAERGRQLFGAGALGCAKCHAIVANERAGGGPSLAGAASRFTVSHLVESILVPNKQVAPIFGTTSITTVEGQSLVGLVVDEDERQIVLLLPNANRQPIAKSAIEARTLQATSPMPSGLIKTPAELTDLLAYLLSSNPKAP